MSATIIEAGTLPPGGLPIEMFGGVVTASSGSANEISRIQIQDPLTGNLVYKKVVVGSPTVTLTLQGGTPPSLGGAVDVSPFGVTGGNYRVVSATPSSSSGEFPSYSIVCEDFEI